MVQTIFGVEPYDTGTVYLDGKAVEIHSPQDAMKLGIGLLTAGRASEIGAVPPDPNLTPREQIGWPNERIWAADVIAARAMED